MASEHPDFRQKEETAAKKKLNQRTEFFFGAVIADKNTVCREIRLVKPGLVTDAKTILLSRMCRKRNRN